MRARLMSGCSALCFSPAGGRPGLPGDHWDGALLGDAGRPVGAEPRLAAQPLLEPVDDAGADAVLGRPVVHGTVLARQKGLETPSRAPDDGGTRRWSGGSRARPGPRRRRRAGRQRGAGDRRRRGRPPRPRPARWGTAITPATTAMAAAPTRPSRSARNLTDSCIGASSEPLETGARVSVPVGFSPPGVLSIGMSCAPSARAPTPLALIAPGRRAGGPRRRSPPGRRVDPGGRGTGGRRSDGPNRRDGCAHARGEASLRAPLGAIARIAESRGPSPFAGRPLYRAPRGPAHEQARRWRGERPADAELMDRLAAQPTALWLGDWTPDVRAAAARRVAAARAQGAIPVLVAYNIPNRDYGLHSAGGAGRPGGLPRLDRRPGRRPRRRPGGRRARARRPRRPRPPPRLGAERPDLAAGLGDRGALEPARRVRVHRRRPRVLGGAGRDGAAPARGRGRSGARLRGERRQLPHDRALERVRPGRLARVGGAPFVIDTSRNGAGPAPGTTGATRPGERSASRPRARPGTPRSTPPLDQAPGRVGRRLQRRPRPPGPGGPRARSPSPERREGSAVETPAQGRTAGSVAPPRPGSGRRAGPGRRPGPARHRRRGRRPGRAGPVRGRRATPTTPTRPWPASERNEAVLDRCERTRPTARPTGSRARRRPVRRPPRPPPSCARSPPPTRRTSASGAPSSACPRWRSTRWCCRRARCCGSAGRPTTTAAPPPLRPGGERRSRCRPPGGARQRADPPGQHLVRRPGAAPGRPRARRRGQPRLPDRRQGSPARATATGAPPGSSSSTRSPRPGSARRARDMVHGRWYPTLTTSRTGAC